MKGVGFRSSFCLTLGTFPSANRGGALLGASLNPWVLLGMAASTPLDSSARTATLTLSLGLPPRIKVYSPPEVNRIWVYGDLIRIYPKPYSIYLREPIGALQNIDVQAEWF